MKKYGCCFVSSLLNAETFSETVVNLTIDFAVGEVSVNFQYVAILCCFKENWSARLFTLYLLQVKECALAKIEHLYNHTIRSYPALDQAKFFKVHSRLVSGSWHSADSLPQIVWL